MAVTFYQRWIKADVERDHEVIRARERADKARRDLMEAETAYWNAHNRATARLFAAWEAAEPHGKP